MARPRVAVGGDGFQKWRVAANVLNKQLRTADKVRSSSFWVWARGQQLFTIKIPYHEMLHRPWYASRNVIGGNQSKGDKIGGACIRMRHMRNV
jgi:hypothetical protein